MGGIKLHPASVHYPIAFITLTGLLDTLHALSTSSFAGAFVASSFKSLDIQLSPSLLPLLSYYSTILAIITVIPAVLTGGSDLLPLILRDGISTSKVRTGIAHAILNDIATFALVYNWWTRRKVEGFAPSSINMALSGAVATPVMLYAASLGGDLVYGYGMGIGNSKSQSKKKQ